MAPNNISIRGLALATQVKTKTYTLSNRVDSLRCSRDFTFIEELMQEIFIPRSQCDSILLCDQKQLHIFPFSGTRRATLHRRGITMDKKDIIHELAKGVQQTRFKGAQAYGRMRTKLRKQGISEIGLYSVVAEHVEENSLAPNKFVVDLHEIMKELAKNPFAVKNNNEYSYLFGRYESIKISRMDNIKFLCNRCYRVFNNELRIQESSYTCKDCHQRNNKGYYEASKSRGDTLSLPNKTTHNEVKHTEPTPTIPQCVLMEPEHAFKIAIDSIAGDAETTMISISVATSHLADLLTAFKGRMK